MAVRSTTSAFFPPPPGKVIPRSGPFRNVNRMREVNASAASQRPNSANACTAPVPGTNSAQYRIAARIVG